MDALVRHPCEERRYELVLSERLHGYEMGSLIRHNVLHGRLISTQPVFLILVESE